MTHWIVIGVVAVFLVLRLGTRFRRRGKKEKRPRLGLGPFNSDVGLVAAREMRERFRGRLFRVGTLLVLAAVSAAIVIPKLDHSKSQPQQVGFVGNLPASVRAAVVSSASSVGTAVRFVPEKDAHSAEAGLRSGTLDLAIESGHRLVVDQPVAADDTSTTGEFVLSVASDLGVLEAFALAHLTPSQEADVAQSKALPITSLERASSSTGTTHTTSLIGLILIFIMLSQYNTWILIGVMEEKSSRVIEVLLAAVRPVQLLTGKVLGIGLVAFTQAAIIVAFALGLAKIVGSDLLHGTAPWVVVSTLLWLVLGYAFYCWVYAAAGSLAERQDQVQTLAFPLSVPIIFGYIVSITAIGSGTPSTLIKVLAYLPPTAPFAMPVLIGLKGATWWEFAASAAISVVCTIALARAASSIYRRAILRTGRRVKLREVLTRASA
jgi:ABC-2 type transport system permease protein